jgi:hypothetical protein
LNSFKEKLSMPTDNKKNCELCKIKVDVTDFTLETAAGLKSF